MSEEATGAIRFCTNCGKELQEGAKFCAFCGTHVLLPAGVHRESRTVETETRITGVPEHKKSFFGWGRARKPVLYFLWIFVLALAFEQLYYDWADSKPPAQHGPAMVFWAGVLAAMYAPKRRFFGLLWFFLGVVGSLFAIGLLGALVRILR